jgi:hypothetical protein
METERKNLNRLTSPPHKNLVQIHSHGYLDYHLGPYSRKRLPVYVMDMELGGESLHSFLKRRYHETGEGLRPVEVWEVLGQIASAVGWIHKRGVIHRDLKPENRRPPLPNPFIKLHLFAVLTDSHPLAPKPPRMETHRLWHLSPNNRLPPLNPRKQRHGRIHSPRNPPRKTRNPNLLFTRRRLRPRPYSLRNLYRPPRILLPRRSPRCPPSNTPAVPG